MVLQCRGTDMYERSARSVFAVIVVLSHIVFVSIAAVFLQNRITKIETYLSTLAVFLPVFGIYVGVVVKQISSITGPRGSKVNSVFLFIMTTLFVAYGAGNAFVIYSYNSGFIASEDMLPGAIALVESAFGGFFTTMFLTLFGDKGKEEQ